MIEGEGLFATSFAYFLATATAGFGQIRRSVNGLADAIIRAAAAKVANHSAVDVFISWIRIGFEQSNCRHDLARLAIAALGHLLFDPGLLYSVEGYSI